MKTLPAFLLFVAVGVACAESVVPVPLDRNLFAETFAQSPFILETKVEKEAVAPETPRFEKDLYLRAISKDNGKDVVMIQKVGEERTIKLVAGEVGEDSMTIKSVKVGGSFHETKVVITKGGETGEVGFKEESINTVAAPMARPPGAPGQNPMNPLTNQMRPSQNPMAKIPVPGFNPATPRPQFTPSIQLPKPQGMGNGPGGGSRGDSNRRIRTTVIGN